MMDACKHPLVVKTLGKSPVTGETTVVHCHILRSMEGMPCGIHGHLWEKKGGDSKSDIQRVSGEETPNSENGNQRSS